MTSGRGGEPAGHDLAGLGERLTALFIDWIACLVITYLAAWLGLAEIRFWGVNLTTPLLFVAYYGFSLGVGSQTLGMAIMRIACVPAEGGDRLGFLRALLRAMLLSVVLPALTALVDPFHRGLHDRAARSVMLKAPRAQSR
ncbi:RDD family protein [Glycomyces xiaoerkulensis]|uniref:RDD family protein n=1 Tax=Glycomyces xiaoerkulensis TaxID=2038139 RepID=UPI000C2628A4|nr:RDD family protein [Glycomyces xiaoerkulensis]